MPNPVDVTVENGKMERFIGAPIELFNPAPDALCIGMYNYFKPAILHFFYLCNHPFESVDNTAGLKTIMGKIRDNYGNIFLDHAATHTKQLIPAKNPGGSYDDDWIDRWFDTLFSQEPQHSEQKLSLIVQGGEALNFYSVYKKENVPTHDCDTRILAGNHFNYTKMINQVDQDVRKLMHKYRFFVVFGLEAALHTFHTKATLTPPNDNENQNHQDYMNTLVQNGTTLSFVFKPILNNRSFEELIIMDQYNIDDDKYIARLLALEIIIVRPNSSVVVKCGLVDLFCPSKRPDWDDDVYRVGQSENIFNYFSTLQANNLATPPAGILNEKGYVPFTDQPLTISHDIPYLRDKQIKVRLVPHGYMIFETLRMLFTSDALDRTANDNKYLKYKQKLNVMLGSLMSSEVSGLVFNYCLTKKSKNANNARYLTGGSNTVNKIEVEADSKPILQNIKEMNEPIEKQETMESIPVVNEKQREARLYSRELEKKKLSEDEEGKQTLPDKTSLTDTQWLGYMDYLSYRLGGLSDYRLPMIEEDMKELREQYNRIKERETKALQKANAPTKKKAVYRHLTQKKRSKGIRTTRRKLNP